jgi:hypothetical protein
MNTNERRLTNRFNLKVPVRFRLLSNAATPEQKAESVNLSQRGVYFATGFPPPVGALVELIVKMPREVTGPAATELRCTARVVHVEPDTFMDGKSGVGVQLERDEVLDIGKRSAN